MQSCKEVRFKIHENVEFVAKKYEDVRTIVNTPDYEYFMVIDNKRCIWPPQITRESKRKQGRGEWMRLVKLKHYIQARELLDAKGA